MPTSHLVEPVAHHLPRTPTTNITIGPDTYTVLGSPGDTISVIRRSGRWRGRNGDNGNNGSTSPSPHLRDSVTPDPESPHLSRPSSESPEHEPGLEPGPAVLPCPDSPAACAEAHSKMQYVITSLRDDRMNHDVLLSNLEYIGEVLGVLAAKAEASVEDDLSSLGSESVPEEVRLWLAATFAKQEQVVKKSEERPTLKSVANAIRTGIFIEKIYRRLSNSQMMAIPGEVETCLKQVNNWDFDLFAFSAASHGSPLKFMGYHLLNQYGCCHKYKIPPPVLESLLGHLEVGYHRNGNPYHNNLHATDVLQTTHWLISQTGVQDWLSDLEIFALLFSAIIHDFDHSGTTNNFHIQSNSSLAIMYNDRSVLENHHVAAFFRTMLDNECFILGNMTKAEFREFRSLMIEMVLHTDMSMHFSQIKQMKGVVQSASDRRSRALSQWRKIKHGMLIATPAPRRKSYREHFDKKTVLSLLLHSADISHPSKKWELHNQWTARCMEEFFKQGDKEQEQGLEFSPLCDRQNTMVPQSQIGFIDFIVAPTLSVCGDVVNLVMAATRHERKEPWRVNIAENKQLWQAKADAGETGAPESDAGEDARPPRPVPPPQPMLAIKKKSRKQTAEP